MRVIKFSQLPDGYEYRFVFDSVVGIRKDKPPIICRLLADGKLEVIELGDAKLKAPFKWEVIHCDQDGQTTRAKVEGGWLVNHAVYPCDQESLMLMTTTFVPDPQHQWVVEMDDAPPTPQSDHTANYGSIDRTLPQGMNWGKDPEIKTDEGML